MFPLIQISPDPEKSPHYKIASSPPEKSPRSPDGRRAGRIFAGKLSAGGDFSRGRSYNGAPAAAWQQQQQYLAGGGAVQASQSAGSHVVYELAAAINSCCSALLPLTRCQSKQYLHDAQQKLVEQALNGTPPCHTRSCAHKDGRTRLASISFRLIFLPL